MTINIRSLQHYMYCKRRFALIEINRDWAENFWVIKANIMHEKVHSGEHSFKSKNLIAESNIQLYNDELDMFGIADCIEFKKDKNGVFIESLNDRFSVSIVEYKPTKPKDGSISQTDAIQIFAQKLCADKIWNCNCEAYIYYSDVRKRVKMPFDLEYDFYYKKLIEIIDGINYIYSRNEIPKREKGQKCSGCSLKDICMPLKENKSDIRKEITKLLEI